uniref:NERD domain-containing protein n=2 Tax=Thermoflexus sp. TaxID=1969742 RepID=UPI002ADD8EE3
EKRLYAIFRDRLPQDFVVFHSVRWLLREPSQGAWNGEADFVIVHPERGLIVLEVKGGPIRYEARTRQWFSGPHLIRDPVGQARRNQHDLMEKLRQHPRWPDRPILFGHAVAFPDVEVGPRDLLPDLPRAIVLDRSDLRDVERWVSRVFSYWKGEHASMGGPGSDGMAVLRDVLARSWSLRPLLRSAVEEAEQRIVELTEEQFTLLDCLRAERRVLIKGCAGSGKTMLALEQARRLGQEGFRVLLTCYNRTLADRLREAELPAGVDVLHFHSLVSRWVDRAGLRGKLDQAARTVPEERLFQEVFPELLAEAAGTLGPEYDALIIDEGQDFTEVWFTALALLLKDPDHGIVYVFLDDNQNIYRRDPQLPWTMMRFHLSWNCRNTRPIHRQAMRFYRSDRPPQARGPDGPEPEVFYYGSEKEFHQRLRQLIHRLLMEEKLPPHQLVILSAHRRGWLQTGIRYGAFTLTERWPPGPGEIFWTTVHRFKGLESPVVILAQLDADAFPDLPTVAYVGMSRARSHLILLAHRDLSGMW